MFVVAISLALLGITRSNDNRIEVKPEDANPIADLELVPSANRRNERNSDIIEKASDAESPKLEHHPDTEPIESGTMIKNSHIIVAQGWPSTSPMWPTIQSAEGSRQPGSNITEPFIFADKPRSVDYGLLLNLNETTLSRLKAFSKPVVTDLSFEFYFNHGPTVTGIPGIKIEVDRQQIKYLKPDEQTKTKVWVKFNEKITIDDTKKFENHDWLKLSLINRVNPSMVAIRRLKIEFSMAADGKGKGDTDKDKGSRNNKIPPAEPGDGLAPEDYGGGKRKRPNSPDYNQGYDQNFPEETEPVNYQNGELVTRSVSPTSLSTTTTTTKKQGLLDGILGRRRKRDTNSRVSSDNKPTQAPNDNSKGQTTPTPSPPEPLVLTCYRADACDLKFDPADEIQWSLARMPASTDNVQNGYYYVSNRVNYGNPSEMLRLSLSETQFATTPDINSDHCIKLALYITESIQLNLYKLNQKTLEKESLLMIWAPTLAPKKSDQSETSGVTKIPMTRIGLPKSRLPALEDGKNGWTHDTLCFGDFFPDPKECGKGKCVFGFEVQSDRDQHKQQPSKPSVDVQELPLSDENHVSEPETSIKVEQPLEQVAGIALLQEHADNIPPKTASKWLETWGRDEVEPPDNWRFYPNQDYAIESDRVTMINLYDGAHYYIESEWIESGPNLNLTAKLLINRKVGDKQVDQANVQSLVLTKTTEDPNDNNDHSNSQPVRTFSNENPICVFELYLKMADSNYKDIFRSNKKIDWFVNTNSTSYDINFPISQEIENQYHGFKLATVEDNKFKIIFEFSIKFHELAEESLEKLPKDSSFVISMANISLSDRCSPNPCRNGKCIQNGTFDEDYKCVCEEKYRGRKCEFGNWCLVPHVVPYDQVQSSKQLNGPRNPKAVVDVNAKSTGREFCRQRLGAGSKCVDIELELTEILYPDEGITFNCVCQDDFYLSDDFKCRPAHGCNSIVCPSPGMICDESKAFKPTQPCKCDESQGWFPDPLDSSATKCIRRQCLDKKRDCGFDAHICLPTIPSEKPICKCGSKFQLVTDKSGQKSCQSTACNLPSLNDCQQVCIPKNNDLLHPYTCDCHPGWKLNSDGRSCSPERSGQAPICKPACDKNTQICTDLGCRCKPGYVGEGEVITQRLSSSESIGTREIQYTQSVKCLNICDLDFAENREEFEKVQSVCPFGKCEPQTYNCKCSDTSIMSLVGNKYEPIYAYSLNSTSTEIDAEPKRVSPLCRLKRVCQPGSEEHLICQNQGSICVPDYTKQSMYDCICPYPSRKRTIGTSPGEFACEPNCGVSRSECLRRNAVCRPLDKDHQKCECLPGFMLNQKDNICYIAKFSYSFNLIVVNKYYEPQATFQRISTLRTNETLAESTESNDSIRLYDRPRYEPQSDSQHESNNKNDGQPPTNKATTYKSILIPAYNQCNITQVVARTVIEDPFDHDVDSYVNYIEQCNGKIRHNIKTHQVAFKVADHLKQTLRQHLKDISVATTDGSCSELDSSAKYLNCTVFLQSQNEPVNEEKVAKILGQCDKQGQSEEFCWVKPRLLLKKPQTKIVEPWKQTDSSLAQPASGNFLNFKQIIPCELNNYCDFGSVSKRMDNSTSLCSCVCSPDIEIKETKLIEFNDGQDVSKLAVKEFCVPMDLCRANSTFCLAKPGSVCHHDPKYGSKCLCQFPAYEVDGKCLTSSDDAGNAVTVVLGILLTALVISLLVNMWAFIRMRSGCGSSKQYQLNEFPSTPTFKRPTSRSTGVPNPVFSND